MTAPAGTVTLHYASVGWGTGGAWLIMLCRLNAQKGCAMDDKQAIEYYRQYRENYRDYAGLPVVSAFELPSDLLGPMLPFSQSSLALMLELFNSVNSFRRLIIQLLAWKKVLDGCGPSDKYDLLLEQVSPLAIFALNTPAGIRGRTIYAAAVCTTHTNHVLFPANVDLMWLGNGNMSMGIASRVGKPWAGWKALAPVLSGQLAHGAIHDLTDSFRNNHEHGYPRNIELGLTSVLTFDYAGGKSSFAMGTKSPIPLATVIQVCIEQHALAVETYDLLCSMLTEQFEALRTRLNPLYGKPVSAPFSPSGL